MKKFIAFLFAIVLCVNLTACTFEGSKSYTSHVGFVEVTGRRNLYYDPDTKIVYVMFNETGGYQGYGYMSPYYAPNGMPYLYDAKNQVLYEIE